MADPEPKWGYKNIIDPFLIPQHEIQARKKESKNEIRARRMKESKDEIRARIKELKKELNIDLTPKLKEHLAKCLSDYNPDKALIDEGPRPSEIRSALKAIRNKLKKQEDKKVKQIIDLLKEIDSSSRSIIQEQSYSAKEHSYFVEEHLFPVNIERTVTDLELLYDAILDALRKVPNGRSGPKKETAWRMRFHGLVVIYKKVTGKKTIIEQHKRGQKYSSPFFIFYKICTKDADGFDSKTIDDIDNERKLYNELMDPKIIL